MALDTEINDYKIQADEGMTGANHPSGLEDTLNREANRIYNLLRIENMFANGANKIRAFSEKIADAGSFITGGATALLGDFEFTITDPQAVVFGVLLTNMGLEGLQGNNANITVEVFIDGVQSQGTSELFFDTHNFGTIAHERTLAKSYAGTLTGSGSHKIEVVWQGSGGADQFDIENGTFLQGVVMENQSLI